MKHLTLSITTAESDEPERWTISSAWFCHAVARKNSVFMPLNLDKIGA